jgi:pullulanase
MKRFFLVVLIVLLVCTAAIAGTKLKIHYHRYDSNYENWDLWLWGRGLNGSAYTFDSEDEYGMVANVEMPEDLDEVGFIVRLGNWADKDVSQDRFVQVQGDVTEMWLLQGVKDVFFDVPDVSPRVLFTAAISDKVIRAYATNKFDTKDWVGKVSVSVNGVERTVASVEKVDPTDISKTNFIEITLENPLTLEDLSAYVEFAFEGFKPARVLMMGILDDYYSDKKMGVDYSDARTTFRVWSPVSSNVDLLLFEDGEALEAYKTISMEMDEKGVWETTVKEDLKGTFYLYEYTHYDETVRAVDPYSKSVYANGAKSAVIDLEETNPENWTTDSYVNLEAPEDAIIYEIHVADVTGGPDSGVEEDLKNTFLGLVQEGTTGPDGVKTGFDSIIDLGITHVHVMPAYDFWTGDELSRDFEDYYNWGYDPYLFSVPEGRYSTDAKDPTARVNEMKQMIAAFHEKDRGVILDMVFPHTYGLGTMSPFDSAVPYYYYKIDKAGAFINESGCGNTIASHRPMMSRYIVDTVKYWVEEYHVDGFRFDQMGFIDVATMEKIDEVLREINPSVLLYGEGWGDAVARDLWMQPDDGKYFALISRMVQAAVKGTNIGAFNDDIRDGIRGSVFDTGTKGFVLDSFPKFKNIQKGAIGGVQYSKTLFWLVDDPAQSINYAACHDNHTLWDKNSLAAAADKKNDWTEAMLKDAQKLSGAIILTAQGIPFIHAGQEFCRTKNNDGNSYNSPISVNALDYARKAEFIDVVDYYRGLIELRRSHIAFRMRTQEDIINNVEILKTTNKRVVGVKINGTAVGDDWKEIILLFNGAVKEYTHALPEGIWNVAADSEQAGIETLYTLQGTITLRPTSALVLYK